ncbi:MAG TPA: amidohydrolase [Acidimicrobiia bacterium]|nr:amidohydrolase [Acidimicrobiia bacterium]
MIDPERLSGLVEGIVPKTVELRRLLHRHPEPSNQEYQTTALIAASLDESGVAFHDRQPRTGLWVDIGPDPRIGFRADLDALPIFEPEDSAPRSQNPGWMHACGHDAHAAIAFGMTLALRQLDLPVGIRILFQPAEESFPGGAADLVDEGLVDGFKGIIAFHVDPSLETGKVGSRVGAITASADLMTIVLEGPGGHTARPHQTVDLIADAARLVHELPGVLRRTIDARSPLTVAFGSVHGGRSGNVIPTRVELQGTARTLDRGLWEVLPGLMDKAVGSLLALSGVEYTLDYDQAIPPVVNDEVVIQAATKGIAATMGADTVVPTEPSMGGEDFANYLAVIPGALLRLGTSGKGTDLHSPGFILDEASIGFGVKAGVAAMVGLAETL